MKRRRFFQAIAAAPAVSAALAQQPTPPAAPPTTGEVPKLEASIADDAAEMVPRFFTAPQLAALQRLGDILMPPINGAPGAGQAHAAEFLDFLLGESPADRKQLYRAGLDTLNTQAMKKFRKAFAELDAPRAETLLAPLREPWSFDGPSDPLGKFLRAAKQDIRTATMNSREYSSTAAATGGRRGGGLGLYWYPLD